MSLKSLILQTSLLFTVMALLLFGAAGTVFWPAGWSFLLSFFVFISVLSAWLLRYDPELLEERLAGRRAVEQSWDRALLGLAALLFIGWLIAMPLDAVRYHWSSVNPLLRITGACLLLCSYYVFFMTFVANTYLSPGVRVQADRGHTVVSSGPYAYVRHPMYAGFALFAVGTALMLGSWIGLAIAVAMIVVVARRAVLEERLLRDQLVGYESYLGEVKYRLMPGVW